VSIYGAETLNLTQKILEVISENDSHDDVWWRTDGKYAPVTFFINCNDLFFWACADAEQITEDNIEILLTAYEDAKAADEDGECYASLLFCARARGMRPQGAYYKSFPKALWALFDACGPERKVGVLSANTPKPK